MSFCGCKSVGVWYRMCVCEGGGWGGNLYPGAPWREPKLDVAGYCMGKSVCECSFVGVRVWGCGVEYVCVRVGDGGRISTLEPLGVNPNLMPLGTAWVKLCVFLCGCKSVGV